MTTSSAPGKVYLFGEHAVVYGEPAVPCAVERRARVTAEPRDDDRVRVDAGDLTLDGFTVTWGGDVDERPDVDAPPKLVAAATRYVDEAVQQTRAAIDDETQGFDITVESDIPLGAGIGSSAAVVVAAIDAATRSVGVELAPETVAERAFQAEYAAQDGQASRADTFCSAMGGAVRVEGDDTRTLDAPPLPFVIGYDGGAGETGELVASVRDLRERHSFAADTVEAIGELTRTGEELLAAAADGGLSTDRLDRLGELMDVDHGLLSALGVSARSLDAMVWAARDGGAHGAKLTGAGGGGCVVALDRTDGTERSLSLTPECEQAFRAELATEGVRVESP
ncbi:mevalonate kinase [Halobaculum sp. MBLA0147]|uniref:mevalonate kinase n=1 Tax=Halobaculum sp. MBLA0147 TaxID=3079934 RepID=UPI003524A1E4